MNRLNLNWNLSLRTERNEFVRAYLASIPFVPNEDELETISNYILWGKVSGAEKDGPARLKGDGIFLESKWNTSGIGVESLDELQESPSFSENDLRPLSAPAPKRTKEVFSREKARKFATPAVLENLEALWSQIDFTELTLNFYELEHGKRKNPPRQVLLDRLTTEEIDAARAKSAKLNQRTYLKLKHQLVDLRQEQLPLQDTYTHSLVPLRMRPYQESNSSNEFGSEIQVLPVGLKYEKSIFKKIFGEDGHISPEDFTQEELEDVSNLLWKKSGLKKTFDFREVGHLGKLFVMWDELDDKAEESESLKLFMDTARFYIKMAGLDRKEEIILEMKMKGKSNEAIRDAVEKETGHRYQLNYISTLYCKKVLEKISEAAKIHREICESLFFPENFKKCKDCGRILLLDERNWVRRKRSNDGFSPRCKKCEKIKRDGAKK